ncbi:MULTISPECIES: TetR/AcrR family transcriptional regulator [unclassified Luteococcus]|uniref:TetR/AcrR family transcriptional regulator n=1 Tax=unclassified Luteococcus TaxID=2639923 RepID=UPI00313E29D2
MAKDVRERMVAGATTLLATKGLQATSFSEVIELTNTPRGSIYHHFPGGKDELVLAALAEFRGRMLETMGEDAQDAHGVLQAVISAWRGLLASSQASTGSAAVAVTVATDTDELLTAAAEVYQAWQQCLAGQWVTAGLPALTADRLAALTLATVEGAVVIARAKRSLEAYDQAVSLLPQLLDGAVD